MLLRAHAARQAPRHPYAVPNKVLFVSTWSSLLQLDWHPKSSVLESNPQILGTKLSYGLSFLAYLDVPKGHSDA